MCCISFPKDHGVCKVSPGPLTQNQNQAVSAGLRESMLFAPDRAGNSWRQSNETALTSLSDSSALCQEKWSQYKSKGTCSRHGSTVLAHDKASSAFWHHGTMDHHGMVVL